MDVSKVTAAFRRCLTTSDRYRFVGYMLLQKRGMCAIDEWG